MEKDSLIFKINEGIHDMCYIWAREMKSTFKDEGVFIFFIFVPLLYPLLYSWIYSSEVVRDVPVAIVDMSHSDQSRTFIRHYDASPDVKVAYLCNSLDEGKALIGKQLVKGIIYIPSDFETNINKHQQTTIGVYCDMSIMLYYKGIYQSATGVVGEMNSEIQIAQSNNFTERDDEVTIKPLDFAEIPIFNSTGGYADFLIPGVLMLILHQTLLLGIGLGAGTARENNRYRDLVPVSRHYNGLFRIVLGKSLCYFMIYIIMAAYIMMVIPKIFGFVQIAQMKELIGLMVPFILATIFFGMMLSCVIRYRENVILLVVFTSVPFLFLSGISWPQSNMPGAWRAIACIFPSTFGIRGFVRLNTMGATLPDIQQEYQALWGQVIVYFFATCAVYRYQIIHARHHAIERLSMMKNKATEAKAKSNK
jgi:ABC-2 type transport system permease protein